MAPGASAARHQPPADDGDEENAGHRNGKAHGCEIEDGEMPRTDLGPEPGHDEVGRRADERGHAAEDADKT